MQEILEKIVKEIYSPNFKNLGFKKKSRNWYKDFKNFGICINIQSSRYNDQANLKFTINTGIFNVESFKLFYQSEPPIFPKEYDCFNRVRIGEILRNGDYWYSLTLNTNIEKLKEKIEFDLRNQLNPYLIKLSNFNELIEFLSLMTNTNFRPSPEFPYHAIFLIKNNRINEGANILKHAYQNAENQNYKNKILRIMTELKVEL
ncbi:DUF4304 domain-containing protein [Leptospira meyeri]|uniref:DUF4304 domain-containing protein n=1 Tax=Leptospira meyeri TaxID=29508 RepID=UPI0010836923|nr:DUF4304 domain-containing protein [Leptospira meyeri]TGM68660.1 DUF4304 domain-containing protein [Leptospira meyeri]TGM70599.1 DUF4304 domain-containing protein [Leptospira meyeri]